MAANSEKKTIEIGSIANMFWYIMNYQYANFGAFITNWAFLSQICWTIDEDTLDDTYNSSSESESEIEQSVQLQRPPKHKFTSSPLLSRSATPSDQHDNKKAKKPRMANIDKQQDSVGQAMLEFMAKKAESREKRGSYVKPPPDEDELFFMSQLPALRRLAVPKKALIKFKMHEQTWYERHTGAQST